MLGGRRQNQSLSKIIVFCRTIGDNIILSEREIRRKAQQHAIDEQQWVGDRYGLLHPSRREDR